jgi:hypothetical protein
MKIVAVADDEQWDALSESNNGIWWIRAAGNFSFGQFTDAAAFFIMQQNAVYDYKESTRPVFINSVITTLNELNTPPHVLRINGWHGFLQRPVWEIAGAVDDSTRAITAQLNKKIIPVKDEPGFVAARSIAMIINEAFFALGDKISTTSEIDIAMKLGTNYPYGPFEWAEKIGTSNILSLLQKLTVQDKRYQPAPALIIATQNK